MDQPVQAAGGSGAQQVEDEVFTSGQHECRHRHARPARTTESPGQGVSRACSLRPVASHSAQLTPVFAGLDSNSLIKNIVGNRPSFLCECNAYALSRALCLLLQQAILLSSELRKTISHMCRICVLSVCDRMVVQGSTWHQHYCVTCDFFR